MEGSVSECSVVVDNGDSLTNIELCSSWPNSHSNNPMLSNSVRRRSASFMAVQAAVLQLTRMNDFVMEKISEGFFAEVYKAQHITTGEIMVLKKNKQFKNSKQMLYEIQLMNRLSHPNILRYRGCCVHEGQLHALTEYMNAGTLEDWILSKSSMPWSIRVKIAIDISNGMSYLHSRGVFHRDLTSKNCLLHLENDVLQTVVADFGLAADIQKYKLHRHNDVVGSPYWMAPECLYGKPYDEKADAFSYGIILAELMARIPADPEYMPRTNNFGMDFEKLRQLCVGSPEKLWHLMMQCCQMDPDSRPTFSQAAATLESIDMSTVDIDQSVRRSTQQNRPEASCTDTSRDSVGNSGRTELKDSRRHSSCSDPGDAASENRGDSGIDPGVFFSDQSKRRLSSSCGALIDKMEEFTTFADLEAYLRSCSGSTSRKESANIALSSPSEHAKSSQTTSPQSVTPSVCKTNKSFLPAPSTPRAPPPTPCVSQIRPVASLPSLQVAAANELLPRPASCELSSPDVSPCVRRRRNDIKPKELYSLYHPDLSSSSASEAVLSPTVSPELLPEDSPGSFCVDTEYKHKKFPYCFYPKRQAKSPPPTITVHAPSIDSV